MLNDPRDGNPTAQPRDVTVAGAIRPAHLTAIAFEHGNRAYRARVGDSGAARGWWWFEVSGDGHRYAPFPAHDDDTEPVVRARIIAYYEDLSARRERRATWHAPSTLIPSSLEARDAFG